MNLSSEEFEKEKQYLSKTIDVIVKLIEKSDTSIQKKKDEIYEMRKYLWDNKLDEIEIAQVRYNVNTETDTTNDKIRQLKKLEKSLESAYFGRIDFTSDDEILPVYIGVNGINDGLDFYVYDWRTPIASLFYNYGKGPASYKAPAGQINGEIILKRQYKIDGKTIERCFDSDLNIDDEYLQEILSGASTEKMKNIVNTIQKDQNAIIRNKTDKVLIVQGIAGSGKTSVAMHRIAYLLYKEKNLKSNNVLIFSPNDIFSDYISNVLPELGEENVLQTTFSDFAKAHLKEYKRIESFTEFVERYYKHNETNKEQYQGIKIKLSDKIKPNLDKFIEDFIKKLCFTKGLKINEIELSKDALNHLLKVKYKKFTLTDKIESISEYICESVNISYKRNGRIIKTKLLELLNSKIDIKNIYLEFTIYIFNKNIDISKFDINEKKIKYEDTILMLYLMFELNGYPMSNDIKQVVIDEAQDYSLIQMQLIKNIFSSASFTILGDYNQTINPYYKYISLQDMSKVFNNSNYIELNKTYRSSEEIINFTNQILELKNTVAVRKNNETPVILKNIEKDELLEQMLMDIKIMKEKGMKRIAIITKNDKQTSDIYELLNHQTNDIALADETKQTNPNDTIILPSYISKGLEFDGVIAYTTKDNQYQYRDRFLFYVVCTRAQHKLVVYNQEKELKKSK